MYDIGVKDDCQRIQTGMPTDSSARLSMESGAGLEQFDRQVEHTIQEIICIMIKEKASVLNGRAGFTLARIIPHMSDRSRR